MQTFFRHLSGAATLALAAVAAMAQGTSATDLTDGEVRRIDQAGGRLTLKHGEIRNLDMPPMTMVFQVRDRPCCSGSRSATGCASGPCRKAAPSW
mgnify:CR=1 FL=1